MFNDKDSVRYEEQLQEIGVTDKQQQKKVLDFMYQLVTIAYGLIEEGQIGIRERKNDNDNEKKEKNKDVI